ncbi:hypothetical protein DXH95_03075 [Sphingorhabdus pulchriflava]|uniref:Uncharacterized protein n=1 Tax=Sphingorhabdus pulchriflava TaxID=2292257 RepID=A0A371BG92_9SPHN|nr:hypothetical protein DXH95_03075 [Sphingorhabdus pulchriflava]
MESAEDLAGFFEEEEFATPARYTAPTPGASPVSCSVIVDRGQGRATLDNARQPVGALDRKIQAPNPLLTKVERDGLFELLDSATPPNVVETLKVVGYPKRDESGVWWHVDVVIVD